MPQPDAVFEVELKFPVRQPEDLQRRLSALNARFADPIRQMDQYYAHPARDFSVTDEALRIRSVGDDNVITYKGPVIDRATKTRREIEVGLAAGAPAALMFGQVLESLGFRAVRQVAKSRRLAEVPWKSTLVTVGWDDVDSLGVFVELELLATEAERHAARDRILEFAAHLGLSNPEPRSYLEQLMAVDAQSADADRMQA